MCHFGVTAVFFFDNEISFCENTALAQRTRKPGKIAFAYNNKQV